MILSTFDWVLLAAFCLQEMTAAVKSMNPPQKETGAYSFWYKFLKQSMNIADESFEQRFKITMPRVNIDETAIQKVTTPTSQTETAVSKTTTTT